MTKVVVAITTFNLENYISQALDSILMQKTNFEFKIRVADDCSSDRTPIILREYQERYPGKVELLFADENMGSVANSNRLFDHIDCEYFSFLDGDDYWVGENRLQEQVDFLDAHQEYVLCGGNTQFLRNGKLAEMMIKESQLDKSYSFHDYLEKKMPFVHTSAILVRNVLFGKGLPDVYHHVIGTFEECAVRGEDFRRLLHLQKGNIFVMNTVNSVYRIHDKGMWQGKSPISRNIEAAISYNFYYKFFDNCEYPQFHIWAEKSYKNMMIDLMARKAMRYPHELTKKDTRLISGLIEDLSHNIQSYEGAKFYKFRYYFIKILSDILHLF